MFSFEKKVIKLFDLQDITYEFDPKDHFLHSREVDIQFIPNCSLPDYVPTQTIKNESAIRLWEDIYRHRANIVDSRILSLLGISKRIHARSTVVKDVSQHELDLFIKQNHLNITTSAKYRYGLFLHGVLVAVAAFGRSCPIQHEGKTFRSHELIRYCSLLNHTVVGGLSKLIHHFENEVKPEHIMTSVDREWSVGKSYLKLGFKVEAITPPRKFWLTPVGCERIYPGPVNQGKSDAVLLREGYKPIFNLGNIKLVKFI